MNFFRKLAGFWADFSPWLLVHMIVFSLAGGYLGYDFLGEKGAAYYYTVILLSIIGAVIFSLFAYLAFGRRDPRYTLNRADPFDRRRIYSCFSGKKASLICESVIDMEMLSYSEALEKLKEIEADKDLSDMQKAVLSYYMGRCYQLMGYPSNAVKCFRCSVENGFDPEDVYFLEARCLVQNGCFDEAVEIYDLLMAKGCDLDFIYTDIGLAYLKKGDGNSALEYFERSLKEKKNYAFALGGCSLAYLQLKDLEKSMDFYRKALNCNMTDIYGFKVFYCNIAEAVGLLGEIDPDIKKTSISGIEIIR